MLGEAPSTTSSSGGGGTALRAGADIAMERRTSLRGWLLPERKLIREWASGVDMAVGRREWQVYDDVVAVSCTPSM